MDHLQLLTKPDKYAAAASVKRRRMGELVAYVLSTQGVRDVRPGLSDTAGSERVCTAADSSKGQGREQSPNE